jgi:hypothetical protein
MHNRPAVLLLLILFSTLGSTVQGQKLINSPFSRFNLGSLEPASSFRSLAMGGTGTAFRDNNSLYYSNPASYSSIDTNSFIFDFGIDYGLNILKEGSLKYNSNDVNFDHLLMGFPIRKGWGAGLGIVNLSNGYYNITEEVNDPVSGDYISIHNGAGGFTSFFIGSGLSINKNFSAGVNMSVLFGKVERSNMFEFADYYNMFHYNSSESLQLSGAGIDLGLQYNTKFGKDYFFNAGASLKTSARYKSDYESIAYRYTAYGTRDTISRTFDNTSKAEIPATLKAGIAIGKTNKYVAGFDYSYTQWTKADINGADGYLGDTRSFNFGVEYIPEKLSNYGFLRRIEYRAGVQLNDNYLVLNGAQVKEKGVSFGLGLPMMRSYSKANFFIDYTQKSIPSSTIVHSENYITMGISLNFFDYWFLKRRYE